MAKNLFIGRISVFVLLLGFLSNHPQVVGQTVNLDSLKAVVAEAPNDTNKVIAYRMLCGILGNTEPRAAIPYGWEGVALSKKLNWHKGTAGCYINLGNAYQNMGVYDTGLVVNDSALHYAKLVGEPGRIALVYINIAAAQIYLNELTNAMKSALAALPYAEASGNEDRLARVYMTMGNIAYYQENWQEALKHFVVCTSIFEKLGVEYMAATCYMNIGVCNKYLGQYDEAETMLLKALGVFERLEDNERVVVANSNLGSLYMIQKKFLLAEPRILKAIEVARFMQDGEQEIYNLQALGDCYYMQGRYEDARQVLIPLLQQAREKQYYEELGNTALSLYGLEKASGNYQQAMAYLEMYQAAQDTLDDRTDRAELLKLQQQYNAVAKEKEIQLLNAQTELDKRKINQQRIMIVAATGILLLAVLIMVLLVNRSRMTRRVKELELRNRIALDLHDDIGSSLSSIRMLSDIALKQGSTAHHLEKIGSQATETVDRMRDIIWMINPQYDRAEDLAKRMDQYLTDMCISKNIKYQLELDLPADVVFNMSQRKNLLLLFKEAVHNAVKYADSAWLKVDLRVKNKRCFLTISDGGKGFDINKINKGNGLESMHHRAKELKGELEIQSTPGKGTIVSLTCTI